MSALCGLLFEHCYWNMKAKTRDGFIILAAALLLGLPIMAVAAPPVKAAPAPPDLTQGGKPDNEHRWTLGATGARGRVWSRYVAGGSENTDLLTTKP